MNKLNPCPFCGREIAIWPNLTQWNITCTPCKYTITRNTRQEVINLYEENWQLFHRDDETGKSRYESFVDAGYTAVEIAAIGTAKIGCDSSNKPGRSTTN